MYCKKCGALRGAASFCTSCGKRLDLPQPPPAPSVPVTPPPAPAMPVTPTTAVPEPVREPPRARRGDPRSRSRTGLIMGLVVGALVLTGFTAGAIAWIANDSPPTAAEGTTFGSDPVLDALWVECGQGNLESCDGLYYDSPLDSEYQEYAATCGNRDDAIAGWCGTLVAAPTPSSQAPGGNPVLDFLWEACAEADFQACDDLYFEAPGGSIYEEFGATCGDRAERAGRCVEEFS